MCLLLSGRGGADNAHMYAVPLTGLSERIQRFTAMELDYCIKAAVIHAILAAPKSPASASPTGPSRKTLLHIHIHIQKAT